MVKAQKAETTQEWVVVKSGVGVLQALAIRQVLQAAGVPATSNRRGEVAVPLAWQVEAEQLLHARPRRGEILALQDFAGYNKAICHALPTITQERSGTPHRSGHFG